LSSDFVAQASQVAKKTIFGVILSEAKNFSSLCVQCTERFFASLRMTKSTLSEGFRLRNLVDARAIVLRQNPQAEACAT
jgi:hypothetical protein